MGCAVEKLDDGQEVDIHKFDTRENAVAYLTAGRGYEFDRHETWGLTSGIDFYQGPKPTLRASLREKTEGRRTLWSVAFWTDARRTVGC